MINAWPIDENYIDYVVDDSNAGVINALSNFPALSRELISSLNENEGKKNISTGFHAIEFLLWGQDLNPAGPGNRPWHDFTDGAKNGDRRRQYLRMVTMLLVEHLETVAADWADGGKYRSKFLAMDSDVALANILKGMGALSGPELAKKLAAQMETTVACTRGIPQPFDQAMLGTNTSPGRMAIKQAAAAAQTQSELIAKAAQALVVRLNL